MCTTRSFIGWKFDLDHEVLVHHRVARRLAREAGDAADVHRARTADRRAAGAAEADRAVDLGLGGFERVEHRHRLGDLDHDLVAVRNVVDRFVEAEDVERDLRH
jgi:hypothetical protein